MENLLEIIRQGQMSALPELAKRLQISEELLLAKLERYEQLGYVKRVRMDDLGCGGNCKKMPGMLRHENRETSDLVGERGKAVMTMPDLIMVILLAVVFAAVIFSYVKKLKCGENCCGTRNVKVKRKRLHNPAGTFTLQVEGMYCENCRRTVTEVVNRLEECKVSYEVEPDVEKVIRQIQQAGFDSFIKEK